MKCNANEKRCQPATTGCKLKEMQLSRIFLSSSARSGGNKGSAPELCLPMSLDHLPNCPSNVELFLKPYVAKCQRHARTCWQSVANQHVIRAVQQHTNLSEWLRPLTLRALRRPRVSCPFCHRQLIAAELAGQQSCSTFVVLLVLAVVPDIRGCSSETC